MSDDEKKNRRPSRSGELVPIVSNGKAATKRRQQPDGVFKEGGTTLVSGQPYALGDRTIIADAVYFVRGLKPSAEGPWLAEADKIAWLDAATGYECIIMRSERGGHLSGYVGLPTGHPLHGFEHEAVPQGLGIDVHGGLSYSKICEGGPTPDRRSLAAEARRICHVPRTPPELRPVRHATDYRVQHDDAWWFGFECNQIYDLVPKDRDDRRSFLKPEVGATYRGEAYVYEEVIHLAAQYRAIAEGIDAPARTGPAPPPIGLDPRKGR